MHHEVPIFLLSLAVLLGSARLLGALAARLGLPAVVGEILAGLLAGKTVLGRAFPGAFAWLGNGTPDRPLHNATFDFNDGALKPGMLLMSALAVRWLEQG